MGKKVTMKQLAQQLGISINAVSLALNDKEGVSSKTQAAVLELASKTGYLEQTEKYNKVFSSKNICVLIRKIYYQDMHFYSRIIYGMEREASKQGYNIIIHFTDEEAAIPDCVKSHKVAGVILVGPMEEQWLEELESYQIPIVIVDSTAYNIEADCVLTDNRDGTFKAVSLLIKSGYRKIGFFGDLDYSLSIKGRYLGYVEAFVGITAEKTMQAAFQETMRYSVLKNVEECVLSHNTEGIKNRLASIEKMPEVFICSNDKTAIMVMNALREMGYRVPEDIGIFGFDDMEIGTMVVPALSTLHIRKKNMGIKAVQTLQWRLNNRKAKPEKIMLSVELVIRDSVCLK